MSKKRKKQRAQAAAPSAPPPAPAPATARAIRWRLVFREVLHQPTLIAAWVATVVTLFALYGAVRFASDVSMGAMREPTGMIFCAAIAFTLFASYWRRCRRDNADDTGG
ncbi:hypothetical protein HQ590_04790 [bacterium]|nr:hypothetical protein [bacterium]